MQAAESLIAGRSLRPVVRTATQVGERKAKIFLALLGKQRDVQPEGWREAAGEFGEEGSRRSIADVTSAEALQEVRTFKKAQKAAKNAG